MDTVIATGVSVNLGVLGLAIEACNLGYQVVVPRDTVAGIPATYAEAVLDNTFPLIKIDAPAAIARFKAAGKNLHLLLPGESRNF